jgi:hypothetical protein
VYQVQTLFTSPDGVTKGQISAICFDLDYPDIFESFNDVTIPASSGGTAIALTKPFREVKSVQITLQEVSGATATGAGRMLLGSAGFPSSVSYSYVIPMCNISQAPRSLAVRSTSTIPMRLPPTQADVPILDVDEEDVQLLDVCHTAGCGSTSSAMKKCQHCQKFVFCGKRCAKQCPCIKHAHAVSGPSRIEDLLNPVAVSSSCPPLPETNTVSCPSCGADMDVHMGTCSFCYEQYCSRYCIPTFLDVHVYSCLCSDWISCFEIICVICLCEHCARADFVICLSAFTQVV